MKTLKQQLAEVFNRKYNGTYHIENPEIFTADTVKTAVREWLEQKRLEYLEANRVFSIIAIDELLKELKQ